MLDFNLEFISKISKDTFPPHIFLGIILILTGTLLTAIPLWYAEKGTKSLYPAFKKKKGELTFKTVKKHVLNSPRIIIMLNLSILLTLLTIVLFVFNYNDNKSAIVWLLMIASVAFLLYMIDKARGKGLTLPSFSRMEVVYLTVLSLAVLIYLAIDCTNWHWIGIPDETCSIGITKNVAENGLNRSIFSEESGFYAEPMLLVAYRAIFVKIFGYSIFAVRISSVLLSVISIPFLYYFGRELWNKRIAAIASVIFAFTPLLLNYSHYAYGMTVVYPGVCIPLAVFVWAIKTKSLLGYYMAGCLSGVFFYMAFPARLVPVLLGLLGILLGLLPIFRKGRMPTITLITGGLLALIPWFVKINENIGVLSQFFIFSKKPETVEQGMMLGTILSKTFMSIVHPIRYIAPFPGHFIEDYLYEPIVGVAFFVGFWICILEFKKHRQGTFLIISYAAFNLLGGALSNQSRPSDTRLLAMVPFVAIVAAIGITRVLRFKDSPNIPMEAAASIKGVIVAQRHNLLKTAIVVCLLGVSVFSSFSIIDRSVYQRHGFGDGTTGELIRFCKNVPKDTDIVFVQPENMGNGEIDIWMKLYGYKNTYCYLVGTSSDIRKRALDDAIEKIKTLKPPLIVAHRLGVSEFANPLKEVLAQKFPQGKWGYTTPAENWSIDYFEVK
jgi:4-amino-4-deoxy-L-arabinose transferase-like glycosyltransferase